MSSKKIEMENEIPKKAQALVVEEVGGPFELVEIDVKPDNLGDNEVLIRFIASGIW